MLRARGRSGIGRMEPVAPATMPTRPAPTPYGGAHGSPLRNLELADRRRRRRPGPRLDVLAGHRRRRRRLLVGGAPARGRPRRDRRAPRRRAPPTRSPRATAPARGCTSTAAARFTVDGGTVYFCNDADQRDLPRRRRRASQPITPEPDDAVRAALRRPAGRRATGSSACASATASPSTSTSSSRCRPTARREPRVLASGHDFYSAPRISPDGTQLAWLTWDHPRMPWEGSELLGGGLRRRRAERRAARRGRGRGGDRPARVEPGRRPALQLGPHGLVEPLPRRLRAA